MPSFQYKIFLLLLVSVPLLIALYYYALSQKKQAAKRIGDASLIARITGNYSASKYRLKFLLALTAIIFLIMALANSRTPLADQNISRNGVDVMLALDVSKSMLARDIKPSRLERARQLMSRLVDQMGNNRVGLVLFAGKAYLQMPLTADHAAAKMYISTISTESVPTQGTVIADALMMCNNFFNREQKKYKSIILISDGEDHDESAINVAKELAGEAVVIHTVGIGSPNGAQLYDEETSSYKTDREGNLVISKLNETTLRKIADETNGTYQLYTQTDPVLQALTAQLNSMDQQKIAGGSSSGYRNYFPYFLAVAFILLLIELFTGERKKKFQRSHASALRLTVLFMLFGQSLFAQKAGKHIQKGNDAYNKKEYSMANESYRQAIEANPESAEAHFNLGNGLMKSGKQSEALQSYEQSLRYMKSPVEQSNAWYNKAVVLQQQQQLPQCIDAYKQSLLLDPGNEDARHNLQLALKKQEEQKKKEQENNEKKKKEEKKEQDKEKKDQDKPQPKDQENKPQPSKLNQQEAENKLKALRQQEKNLQDKLNKSRMASPVRPEKDW